MRHDGTRGCHTDLSLLIGSIIGFRVVLSSFFVQELHLPVMRMVCLSLARDAKAVMAMPDPTLHILGNHVNLRINSRSNHI